MTEPGPAPFHGYVLCASPRTGSTLLCDLLAATGVAGAPDSFFMEGLDPHWTATWGLPKEPRAAQADPAAHAQAFLAAVKKAGRGGSAVFGLRLMHASLPRLLQMIDTACPGLPTDKARLDWAFGNLLYVHLTRHDKLAQAVSMVKAEQTGLWHIAPDGTELERLAPPAAPQYDFARIAAKRAALTAADADWQDWFRATGITPLTLPYEVLAADPAKAVASLLQALGQDAPRTPPEQATGRLADKTSADWISRFKAEAALKPWRPIA